MTAQSPRVSVVMPVYNREVLVERAIASILDQDFTDFELIVIDDGSSDGTRDTITGFADPRIRLTTLPVNCGIAMARNLGHRLSRGEFIATMDSDNVAMPGRLGKQVRYLDAHPDIDILGTRAVLINGDDRQETSHPATDDLVKARLLALNGSAMFHSTMMVRAEFLRRTALAYPAVPVDEDHAFWIEAMACGAHFAVIPELLLERHCHEGNITSAKGAAETDQFRRKTPLRARVLGLYFPHLSFDEATAVAALMEEGRGHSVAGVSLALAAIHKASLETRSFFGESRAEIASILNHFANMAMKVLSRQS